MRAITGMTVAMAGALAVMLSSQAFAFQSPVIPPEPQHMRYERSVSVGQGAAQGREACAVLDASVFAHAASGSANDLRLFDARGAEVPFGISVNEAQPAEVETARVLSGKMQGRDLIVMLGMPQRAFTDVALDVDARDFVAKAEVFSVEASGAEKLLGKFVLYDLSREGLGRFTVLNLQETTASTLKVAIHPLRGTALNAAMLRAVAVPPSRQSQTLTSTVIVATNFEQRGNLSVATISLPAHVPVERIRFDLDSRYTKSFHRNVTITAKPDAAGVVEERIEGEIWHVRLPEFDVDTRQLAIPAVFGANLGSAATVEVAVENAAGEPLPVRSVHLEMRRRTLCFSAQAQPLVLRYGDSALHAPVYTDIVSAQPGAAIADAALGAEELNPRYVSRMDERSYMERHPEMVWIGFLGVVAVVGGLALHGTKKKGRHR